MSKYLDESSAPGAPDKAPEITIKDDGKTREMLSVREIEDLTGKDIKVELTLVSIQAGRFWKSSKELRAFIDKEIVEKLKALAIEKDVFSSIEVQCCHRESPYREKNETETEKGD